MLPWPKHFLFLREALHPSKQRYRSNAPSWHVGIIPELVPLRLQVRDISIWLKFTNLGHLFFFFYCTSAHVPEGITPGPDPKHDACRNLSWQMLPNNERLIWSLFRVEGCLQQPPFTTTLLLSWQANELYMSGVAFRFLPPVFASLRRITGLPLPGLRPSPSFKSWSEK